MKRGIKLNIPSYSRALIATGSYTFDSCSVTPSNTISAIPAILTGAPQEVHQLYEWTGTMKAESIIEVFEEAGYKCAIVGESENLGGYKATYNTGFNNRADFDEYYFGVAVDWIRDYAPFFMFIYDPMPDRAGHQFGLDSPEYMESIEVADYQVGRIMDVLHEEGIYDETLIVLTTDHSLVGTSHSRGPTFSIWSGPGVKKGYEMDGKSKYVPGYGWVSHSVDDIAPTICNLVDLRSPMDATGSSFAEQILIVEQDNVDVVPRSVTGPFIEGMQEVVLLGVEVEVSRVENLKEWRFTSNYDNGLLDLWDIRIDPEVKAQTGGLVRSGEVFTFSKPFSGSGVLVRYYFKPKHVGSASFSLHDVEMINDSGEVIPVNVSSCLVTVIPIADWLKEDSPSLELVHPQAELTVLTVRYQALNQSYLELQSNLTSAIEDKDVLESTNHELIQEIAILKEQIKENKSQGIPGFTNIELFIGLIIIVLLLTYRHRLQS